jgi:hypothetical protein
MICFYRSTILADTRSPKWTDEEWIVRNVPLSAKLVVNVYDKDNDALGDDYIGQFEITDLKNYEAPSKGVPILGTSGQIDGYFHLTIESIESPESSMKLPRYTFDGPCYFTRHKSQAMGHLTMLNTDCVYSTWKIQMRQISVFLPPFDRQQWNRQYRVAQAIFDGSPRAVAKQHTLKIAHKLLYGSTLKNDETGRLANADDLWRLILTDDKTKKIRICIYTYVIDDSSWRFSETGTGYFTDYASKHALHANCSESVRYAGQFHPRPKYGWDRCDDEWELSFDNWSGTYAPNQDLLKNLKELLEFNFPGLNISTYDFKDPLMKESMEQLKVEAEKNKKGSGYLKQMFLNSPIFGSK